MTRFLDKLFKRNIGVALGGGGARGVAHLGVLKVLKENDTHVKYIAGTSAGSIIASLYAFGLSIEDIERELKSLKPSDIRGLSIGELGIMKNLSLNDLLKRALPENAQIQDAKIPLAIHTTDIKNGEGVTLTSGSVRDAVLASCCVPGVYIPKLIDNRILVDGGLTENVPVDAVRKLGAGFVMAVNLNGNFTYDRPDSIIEVATNAFDIAIDSRTRDQLKSADLAFDLSLTQYSRTSPEHFQQLIETGYSQAKKILEEDRKESFF